MFGVCRILLVAGLVGALASCGMNTSQEPQGLCREVLDRMALSDSARKALAYFEAEVGGRCSETGVECVYRISSFNADTMIVSVAFVHHASGDCVQIPGDGHVWEFSQSGDLLRKLLVL